jgi:hypothetical protein
MLESVLFIRKSKVIFSHQMPLLYPASSLNIYSRLIFFQINVKTNYYTNESKNSLQCYFTFLCNPKDHGGYVYHLKTSAQEPNLYI